MAIDNRDAGTPHDVAIHEDNASGVERFKGDIVNGPTTKTYDLPALDAGNLRVRG